MSRELHFDFETRSPLDLSEVGVHRYFEHPQTQILMAAYAFGDGEVDVWECHKESIPARFEKALRDPNTKKVAWNIGFEHTATHKRLGIFIPFEETKDPSVGARHLSIPGKLANVGRALDLPLEVYKNEPRGAVLRKLFTEPVPVKKRKQAEDKNVLFDISPIEEQEVEREYVFNDHKSHPKEWEEFVEYCRQDVVAERAVEKCTDIFPLTEKEQKMWYLDQKINLTGIASNKDFAKKCFDMAKKNRNEYTDKIRAITGLENPNSNQQMLAWVSKRGYPYNSLRKEPVRAALTDEQVKMTDDCRSALDILKYSKKTSYTKLEAMINARSADGRLRDQFMFLGSPRAGRWTGRDVQLQNMARPIKAIEKKGALEKAIGLIFANDYEGLKQAFPKDPLIEVLTSCIRSALVAEPGNRLDVCDLNAIENRVLGWVSGEEAILDVFRDGKCPYLDFASFWFNIPYAVIEAAYNNDDPDAKFKRQISKPAVLGCGYRQAGGDWGKNKYGDRVKTGLWKYAEDMFCPMSKDQAHEAVAIFRGRFKKVVQFWYDSERAVMRCIKTGAPEWLGPTNLIWCDRRKRKNGQYILRIHLPSGRCLHYLNVHTEDRELSGRDGTTYMKETIIYDGVDQTTKMWGPITTHGGKLTENIVQAIARDLLVEGLLRADEIGMRVVAHVHDEIICEQEDSELALGLDDLMWCMSAPVDWAPGLPLKAGGWSGKYYKK